MLRFNSLAIKTTVANHSEAIEFGNSNVERGSRKLSRVGKSKKRNKMKRLIFIVLMAIFLVGQPFAIVFSQETETVQNETTELSRREQRKLKREQKKEEKEKPQEAKNPQIQQIEEQQEDNVENIQPQPKEKETENEIQPVQKQETKVSNSSNTNSDNETVVPSNNKQETNVSTNNKQPNKPFPVWGWFVIIGIIAFFLFLFRYTKYLRQEFGYNVASALGIVLPICIGFLYIAYTTEDTQIMGVNVFFALFIVCILFLYIYNLVKTNWLLAFINVALQLSWLPVVIVAFVNNYRKTSNQPSNDQQQSNPPQFNNLQHNTKTEYFCEYCGKSFRSIKELTMWTSGQRSCQNHPSGSYKGPHKLYEGTIKSQYTCKYCGKSFKNLKELTMWTSGQRSCQNHPNGSYKGPHAPTL